MSYLDDIFEYDDQDDLEEDTQKDKYLIFKLSNESYGIEIVFVKEIVGFQKIIKVPKTEDYIEGVINLRGKIIPVIDVRTRFQIEKLAYHDRTCIIITAFKNLTVGLIVDSVSEVLNIIPENMDDAPITRKNTKNRFIKNMAKVGNEVKIILDMENFLNEKETESIVEGSYEQ